MQNINVVSKADVQYSEAPTYNNNINIAVKEGEICVENIGSTISDEEWEKIVKSNSPNPAISTSLSTTYKNFSPAEISKIKQLIYDLHNSPDIEEGDGGGNGEIGDGGEIEEGGDNNEPSIKQSFIKDFADTETMFEYMNTINPEITKKAGVTRAQLIEFTQNDDWEDDNYDFFGSLNRIFAQLDTDKDDKLSYAEIEAFIEEELGTDFQEYKNKVNDYCNQIQAEYEKLSNQKKLEFAIEKTREYLEASNMTPQLEALDRLTKKNDTHNTTKVGQIAVADFEDDTVLGAYTYSCWVTEDYDNGENVSDFNIFAHDDDEEDADLGITLNDILLDQNWYVLVNTLVHELTHATAYRYYSGSTGAIDKSIINKLYSIGALSEDEFNKYDNNWAEICKESKYEDELDRLYYLASTAWGEYAAYQVDADYNDSIGQDVYKQAGDNTTTTVDGYDEKDEIMAHINNEYETQPIPDYKWWSYA